MGRVIKQFGAVLLLVIPSYGSSSALSLPPDIPKTFNPVTSSFDHIRREVEIPMRDGVKLHAVLIIPKGAGGSPIMLDRTPYGADKATDRTRSAHGDMTVSPRDSLLIQAGYIVAYEDVRGKYGSGGDYVNERPLRGPDNPTNVDHSTDAWDTIDWLIKNVKETNGRVGLIGSSYDGMMVAMALIHPHPALRAAVAANPVINTWMGDDDFHGGAMRLINYDFYFEQDSVRGDGGDLWRAAYDDYDTFLRAGSASGFVRAWGLDQLPYVRRLHDHPAYDAYWKAQALETILPRQPQTVPTLWVAGQWDQEDMYGAAAAFEAVHAHDPQGVNHLIIGPWRHLGWEGDGSHLGPIRFDADTALWFRKAVLIPFLDSHLKNEAPAVDLPPVLAFQTGTNRWQRLHSWPQSCAQGCASTSSQLYLQPGGGLAFALPTDGAETDDYISDPAKPVPYRIRPIRPTGASDSTWERWLVDDQRPFSDRPDVLVYETPPLKQAVAMAGAPVVNLVASTTGTDSDFVVKLIDVYPDEYPEKPELGGYQLAIAMDILRGRYRGSFEQAEPITPGIPLLYRFSLPNADHVFLPGHRIMVQVQSSWFPLYDRNPQTFVSNVFDAQAGDYRKATISVYHAPTKASFIELPTVDEH